MKLFNFFKRKQKPDSSTEQTIKRLVEYMPKEYMTNRHFLNCIDFLEKREFEFVIYSLIELAKETGHYFSEEYWIGLEKSAKQINLTDAVNYCKKQIKRNEIDLRFKTSFGHTTIKIDNNHFQSYISEIILEKWANERRKKDNVYKLLTKEGVHIKSHGRDGYIYINENGNIAEVYYELQKNGLYVYFNQLINWSLPIKQKLKIEDRQRIKTNIKNWAIKSKNAVIFDD